MEAFIKEFIEIWPDVIMVTENVAVFELFGIPYSITDEYDDSCVLALLNWLNEPGVNSDGVWALHLYGNEDWGKWAVTTFGPIEKTYSEPEGKLVAKTQLIGGATGATPLEATLKAVIAKLKGVPVYA